MDRSLLPKNCKPKRKDSIPFSVTYNSVLPNIKEMVNKHWHILNIDSSFKERLNSSELMIAFRKTTSLKESIGTNTIRNNQKFLAPTQTTTAGQCTPCYTNRLLCCQQVLKTTTFTSTQPRQTFTTFHQVTYHGNYVIHSLECIMCKIQYVGKSETLFNMYIHCYFNNNEYTFSKHGKFIIIEQLGNISTTPTETLKLSLNERKNF